jgi:4-azaleucine resistance transporter AzlC
MIAQKDGARAIFTIACRRVRRSVPRVTTTTGAPNAGAAEPPRPEPFPERQAILRAVVGIGLYAGMFGITFGAVSVGSGLSVAQTMVLSAVMFTGASQFALVGIIAAGGSPYAAVSTALLLGLRNAFYGVPVSHALRPRGMRRFVAAQLVIDETTAMTIAQPAPRARRHAFWATGFTLFVLWNLGSLAGALAGGSINPSTFGLDAAAPAIFLALLWPQLSRSQGRSVALGAAAVALALIAIAPAGVPVIAAAGVAVATGIGSARRPDGAADR